MYSVMFVDDTILVDTDPGYDGMQGTNVAQAKLFLSFCYKDTEYHCVLVLPLGIVLMKTLVCGSLGGTTMPMDTRSCR